MNQTATALLAELRPFRRWALVARGSLAVGVAAGAIGAFAWLFRLGWLESPWWVLVAWGAAGVAIIVMGWLGVRRLAGLSPTWLADRLEGAGFRRGSLRAHLEPAQSGTSLSLMSLADESQARSLRAEGRTALSALALGFRRRSLRGGIVLVAGLLLMATSGIGGAPPRLMWRPLQAAAVLRAPVGIRVTATEVEPGAMVSALIRARGRREAMLWSRSPGETWHGEAIRLDSVGETARELGPIKSDLFLRVTSGGRSSDTVAIRVRMPAFLGALLITARYARYLGLEDEPIPLNGDTVVLPEGTRLEVRGSVTSPLAHAAMVAGPVSHALSVERTEFRGVMEPRGDRTWTLTFSALDGRPIGGDSVRIPIVVVRDSIPTVDLPVPGADTVLSALSRVPVVASAQDDHGIAWMVLESRRISRIGDSGAVRRDSVPLPADRDRQVIVPVELNLEDRGLLPGDTLRVRVRVRDNSPRGQEGVSKEYAFRLATRAELRESARQVGEGLRERLAEVSEESRQLERRNEDLAAEQNRRGSETGANPGDQLSYQDAQRAEAVAESQAELMREAQELQAALEQLQASAEAAGLDDPEFQRRLEEVRDQLARALTPELRERLSALQEALTQLDGERTRTALERLAEAQRQLREALERSRELFERAALEGDLANAEAEARELASEEGQWSEEVAVHDSVAAAREETSLADRADSLAAMLERAAEAVSRGEGERPQGLDAAAEALRDAAQQMKDAAAAAQRGDRPAAQRKGQEAADQLDPLGDQVAGERQQMQERWRKEVLDALDRVLADATRLSDRQLRIAEALRTEGGTPSLRADQGAVEDGVKRLLEQMQEVSGKNALVPTEPSVALAAGRDAMREVRETLSSAAPNTREAARRAADAVDALNAAAHGLVRARGAVQGSASGSGMAEALQQLNQMAQQQGQLGQQAGSLLPLAGQGGQAQEQLRALGARQRAVAERLERMRAGGQIPGAADMAAEARDLARTMEAGRVNRQTIERQERLFRRMLDAGRTLQGEDQDERQERRSETARSNELKLPTDARVPPPDEGAVRMPTWEELRSLAPEERRRAVEYFRRLGENRSPEAAE
ncbi:MAG: MFS transporter [Gemmatimonadales bacterium]|nr:MAG: MFS transporter [Gemmatimonadales bacterium]